MPRRAVPCPDRSRRRAVGVERATCVRNTTGGRRKRYGRRQPRTVHNNITVQPQCPCAAVIISVTCRYPAAFGPLPARREQPPSHGGAVWPMRERHERRRTPTGRRHRYIWIIARRWISRVIFYAPASADGARASRVRAPRRAQVRGFNNRAVET